MNWTTEYLARKVKSGEKKKHKERRAVEIMLQQTLSELRKSEVNKVTEERIVGWLLFLILNTEGRNTTVKMKERKTKGKEESDFSEPTFQKALLVGERRGAGGGGVRGSWATVHPDLFPPPPHENSAVPPGVDGT